ncbi:hypothetical protein LSPH24S_10138 [Lysinibacillus sphaericus]
MSVVVGVRQLCTFPVLLAAKRWPRPPCPSALGPWPGRPSGCWNTAEWLGRAAVCLEACRGLGCGITGADVGQRWWRGWSWAGRRGGLGGRPERRTEEWVVWEWRAGVDGRAAGGTAWRWFGLRQPPGDALCCCVGESFTFPGWVAPASCSSGSVLSR